MTASLLPTGSPLLDVEGLDVAYGDFQVLWQAAIRVGGGEIVAVLGPNGAGKSTLMNTISGLIAPRAGSITFSGKRIDSLPAHRTAGEGLAHVLERRRLFPFLTVLDNVLLGAHNPSARTHRADTLARVERLFPVVTDRRTIYWSVDTEIRARDKAPDAGIVALRGGSEHLVALAPADDDAVFWLDGGLAPVIVQQMGALIRRIRDEQGISILFIEQNVELALRLADRGYVLESGRTILSGPSAELLQSAEVKRIFLGDVAL